MGVKADADFKRVACDTKLDRYYMLTGYPNGLPSGAPSRHFDEPEEGEEALRLAKNVIDLVELKIEGK